MKLAIIKAVIELIGCTLFAYSIVPLYKKVGLSGWWAVPLILSISMINASKKGDKKTKKVICAECVKYWIFNI